MKIRKVLIITQSKFTKRDYARFEVDYFIKNNYQVIIYDLTKILRSSFYINNYTPSDSFINNQVRVIKSIEDFENDLAIEKNNSYLFAMCWINLYYDEIMVFKLLSKYNIPYSQFKLAILPDIRPWYIRILSKHYYDFKTKIINKEINPADLVLLAGKKAKLQIGIKKSKKSKQINCGSFDYNLFIDNSKNEKKSKLIDYPEIVFIDQYWPSHPDFDGKGLLNPEFYYTKVNTFLNELNFQFNMTCGIAFHPRTSCDNNYFIYNGYTHQTIDLIKNAKIVVAHHSTSLSFAVLYNKPIIHISFLKIKNTINHKYIQKLSELLQTPLYYIDNKDAVNIKIPTVNEKMYKQYIRDYLLDKSTFYTNNYKVEVLNFINSKASN